MGSLGVPEMLFILVLALLIFGPRKLPELGRTVGKALAEFRRASTDLRVAIEDEVRELDKETRAAVAPVEDSHSIAPPGPEVPPTPGPGDEASAEAPPVVIPPSRDEPRSEEKPPACPEETRGDGQPRPA